MAIKNILLPELGEGVTEGELIKWLVSEGDSIQMDQAIAEVMTDKASMEVPAPLDGVVESFLVKEGSSIQVGAPLLSLKIESTKPSSEKNSNLASKVKTEESSEASKESVLKNTDLTNPVTSGVVQSKESVSKNTDLSTVVPSVLDKTNNTPPLLDDNEDILATPFTRRLAKELGVSLKEIQGSGLAGRITKEDVMKHSGSISRSPLSATRSMDSFSGFSIPQEELQERQALKGIRKKISDKMQLSKKVIPHFTLLDSADVEQLEELKNAIKEMLKERQIKVTYLSFVMKALLHTIKEFPLLNAGIDDFSNEIVTKHYYNIGFAVDTPRGLLVPVVKDVDKKSLAEVSFEIQTLAEKARLGTIQPDDMSGGTITITNIGSLGGEYATPIINAPEVAILGMYRLQVKPQWDGQVFQPRKTMNFSLTCDHRLIDGAVSARVLKSFIKKLKNPLNLFI